MNKKPDKHSISQEGSRKPGAMSLYNLVRCILLNKNLEAKKHAVKDFNLIGEYMKSRIDQVFQNGSSFNAELQEIMNESVVLEDEMRKLLPPEKECLLLKYDEITNRLCDVLREEAYLQGVCDGAKMESLFTRFGDENLKGIP